MNDRPKELTDTELWLALGRAPHIDARRGLALIAQHGGIGGLFASGAGVGLSEDARCYFKSPDWAGVERDLRWLENPNHYLIPIDDKRYPPRLLELPDPPLVLFVAGSVETLSQPQLAMVGSRNATPAALETAFEFAYSLASIGLAITSGLAFGIDAASHRGALAAEGYTLAVLGCGPAQVYPRQHGELQSEIDASGGAVVSEFPTGARPLSGHFPRRNRIISGLSLGVLVVEAALRSGSLITARHSMEQGREVFAMPGSIHNPVARGCHALIKQGAKLVETVDDILEEIGVALYATEHHPKAQIAVRGRDTVGHSSNEHSEEYKLLLHNIDYHPTSVDQLVERTSLTAQVVSSMLLQLELGGYVSSISGGRYTRTARNPK